MPGGPEDWQVVVSIRAREFREVAGIYAADAAKAVGVTKSQYLACESGSRDWTVLGLMGLARLMQIPVESFFEAVELETSEMLRHGELKPHEKKARGQNRAGRNSQRGGSRTRR